MKVLVVLLISMTLFSRCSDSREDQPAPMVLKRGSVGFQGGTWELLNDSSIGNNIAGVMITFTKSDSTHTQTVYSDRSGWYQISLPAGAYQVVAAHPDYEIMDTSPGLWITGTGFQTGNIFLKKYTTGYQGHTFEQLSNGIGPLVSGVAITFTKSDNALVKTVYSDSNGSYKVGLPAGNYYVTTSHPDYETYQTAPAFFVVTGTNGFQTGNFFLTPFTNGFTGFAWENGSGSPKITGLQITFTKTDNSFTKTVFTDAFGHYKISLPPGGYFVVATHRLYETYQSSPGVWIVLEYSGFQTGNFFLTAIE